MVWFSYKFATVGSHRSLSACCMFYITDKINKFWQAFCLDPETKSCHQFCTQLELNHNCTQQEMSLSAKVYIQDQVLEISHHWVTSWAAWSVSITFRYTDKSPHKHHSVCWRWKQLLFLLCSFQDTGVLLDVWIAGWNAAVSIWAPPHILNCRHRLCPSATHQFPDILC